MPGFKAVINRAPQFAAYGADEPLTYAKDTFLQVDLRFDTRGVSPEDEAWIKQIMERAAHQALMVVGRGSKLKPEPETGKFIVEMAAQRFRDAMFLRLHEKGVPKHVQDQLSLSAAHYHEVGAPMIDVRMKSRNGWEFSEPVTAFPSERLVNELLMLA